MARKAKSIPRLPAGEPQREPTRELEPEPIRFAIPNPAEDLGLEQFANAPDDMGLSLEELSEAYASLLSGGADPYAPVGGSTAGADETLGDELDAESDRQMGENSLPGPGDPAGLEAGLGDAAEFADAGALDQDAEPRPELEEVAGERLPQAGEAEISPRTILEAMLFVGNPTHEPLTAKHVASMMRGVRAREIDELIVELNETYAAENCPYCIESAGAGYRLALRPDLSGLRDRFYGRVKDAKLSQQAIDVLALVAYNQPLTRPEIDKLRNASSGGVLSQLVRRGLLRVERPDRKPREPIFYTTDRFLELFGLESLDDLPKSLDAERAL